MKFRWLKFLLLATFAFWATGAAKYTHELLEHHGHDASVDDDDDDDATPAASTPFSTAPQDPPQDPLQDPLHPPVKHSCPICQMLAGMAVQQSAPPALPTDCFQLIETLIIADHVAPTIYHAFARSARDPPVWL